MVNLSVFFVIIGKRLDVAVAGQGVLDGFGGGIFDEAAADLLKFGLADGLGAGSRDEEQGGEGEENFFHMNV